MPSRYLSIHGHFYQPPREDPFSGQIPIEPGAAPYPNWNERIYAECYLPNVELGNFARLSFNLGPTLCAWLEGAHPAALKRILAQDRENLKRFGVGNAIAQPFNHTILPLASYRDKVTQVAWGIADFEHRFGRKPAGMWLPETAVDLESLSILEQAGIQFTLLAPWQAEREHLDVTEPYRVNLSAGRSITVFFYQAELSGGVSFNPEMTANADRFVESELSPRYHPGKAQRGEAQLLLIASDGELYGHHMPLRQHFLAYLLNHASERQDIAPTFPALWLKSRPARRPVTIREKTSWSCRHGVERWRGPCACIPGDGRWKAALRSAFDRLGAALDAVYYNALSPHVPDPWALRHEYIYVVLGLRSLEDLVWELADRCPSPEDLASIHLLLEAQRERQRMFTSCGFYFEDFDRIEPKNNVAYAAQAVRLTHLATGVDLSADARAWLQQVTSPSSGLRGDTVFVQQMALAAELGNTLPQST